MSQSVKFPWHRVERGQGFFIPALDVDACIKAGLLAAIPFRFRDRARASVGIYEGRLGVMFYRVPPGTASQSGSSPPESPSDADASRQESDPTP